MLPSNDGIQNGCVPREVNLRAPLRPTRPNIAFGVLIRKAGVSGAAGVKPSAGPYFAGVQCGRILSRAE
jgi:hypothetical protein